jgi:hypothetical protein
MCNVWTAEIPVTEDWTEVAEFLARDFDPFQLWENHGYHGRIAIRSRTNRGELVAMIEERNGKPWVQPYDDDGKPCAIRFD